MSELVTKNILIFQFSYLLISRSLEVFVKSVTWYKASNSCIMTTYSIATSTSFIKACLSNNMPSELIWNILSLAALFLVKMQVYPLHGLEKVQICNEALIPILEPEPKRTSWEMPSYSLKTFTKFSSGFSNKICYSILFLSTFIIERWPSPN